MFLSKKQGSPLKGVDRGYRGIMEEKLPKIRGTVLGAIIRTKICWGLYRGSPYFVGAQGLGFRVWA